MKKGKNLVGFNILIISESIEQIIKGRIINTDFSVYYIKWIAVYKFSTNRRCVYPIQGHKVRKNMNIFFMD
ncbi:hypothetical protein DXA95_16985 [Odoribacter sp. OF09-27XD]|nr:hypothetical protein DXA95_16985 [Odoribacter sp. OF09-27XD]